MIFIEPSSQEKNAMEIHATVFGILLEFTCYYHYYFSVLLAAQHQCRHHCRVRLNFRRRRGLAPKIPLYSRFHHVKHLPPPFILTFCMDLYWFEK